MCDLSPVRELFPPNQIDNEFILARGKFPFRSAMTPPQSVMFTNVLACLTTIGIHGNEAILLESKIHRVLRRFELCRGKF